ncbi:MAG: antibiotic biosynthesis monooxygenase [Verrucomicrobiales bacterium]|nr:antibiotic biosynthesis monooxygenase [Verrucomicrobiales bacterium]|tara:strand:- start:4074 stop:4643 length:570 start_codon:yes stop_codon:yes gene_type:complete
MSTSANPNPDRWVGLVISETVRADRLEDYQAWSLGICEAANQAPGFRARQVIEPRDASLLEYLIVLKFDTVQNMDRRHQSDEYHRWLMQSEGLFEARSQHQHGEGMELWYVRPDEPVNAPPFWKQVVLGSCAVYPSIILLRWITTPLLGPLNLHPDLNLLISVVLLSILLTWPIMPGLSRLLRPWLYGR